MPTNLVQMASTTKHGFYRFFKSRFILFCFFICYFSQAYSLNRVSNLMASQSSAKHTSRSTLAKRNSVIRFVPYQSNVNSRANSRTENLRKSETSSGIQSLTRWVEEQNLSFWPGTSLDRHIIFSPPSSPDLVVD